MSCSNAITNVILDGQEVQLVNSCKELCTLQFASSSFEFGPLDIIRAIGRIRA